MRWNNYELNVYTHGGTVGITAYPLAWTGAIDAHGFPIYLAKNYDRSPFRLSLFMNRTEHDEAIRYALDSEYWDDTDELFRHNYNMIHEIEKGSITPLNAVIKHWDDFDEWQDASSWTSPPEPILSWLKSLPLYSVTLDADLESSLIDAGMLGADGTTDLWSHA